MTNKGPCCEKNQTAKIKEVEDLPFIMLELFTAEENIVTIDANHLVASKHIKAGSILLIQPPLASVPLPAKRHQRCNNCLKKAQLQCCSRCRSAYFCSNECFRNAWLHFHRVLCEPQQTDVYKDVDADRWLLERTALTLDSHKRLNKQHSHSPPHLPASIQALQTINLLDSSATTIPQQQQHQEIVDSVANFLSNYDCQLTKEELDTLWHRIRAASFPIQDIENHLEEVAIGVYPITNLFVQHSCRPNAALSYKQGGVQNLIAIEDISPGKPITITYADLISTKQERGEALKSRFGNKFKCHCNRCEGDLACLDAVLEKGETLKVSEKEAESLLEHYMISWSVLDMVKYSESKREKGESLSPVHTLDIPSFCMFINRIATPDIYYAPLTEKKKHTHHPESYLRVCNRNDRDELYRRIPLACQAIANIPQAPSFTVPFIKAAERLLRARITEGKWVESSRCALFLAIAYRLLYPLLHPKVSHHTLILARAGWNALVEMELIGVDRKLERIYENGAQTWIELARTAVATTFGRESNLWRDVIELQWVYEREQKVRGTA
ncbi:hypothetical protein BDF20DRAFT_836649 [Mycotypha africana]|uniref:uncharacterized protein n=1 Tax=Mycotypha africana TaxID=64632 RepID=UPI002300D7E2|nr:uncharacterized protein BDF20DRAFT_836649 [Mycotypha africana]KAI8975228.1 hypothetical protein BDF20DRAFT_836649 [Mycotypha africana]